MHRWPGKKINTWTCIDPNRNENIQHFVLGVFFLFQFISFSIVGVVFVMRVWKSLSNILHMVSRTQHTGVESNCNTFCQFLLLQCIHRKQKMHNDDAIEWTHAAWFRSYDHHYIRLNSFTAHNHILFLFLFLLCFVLLFVTLLFISKPKLHNKCIERVFIYRSTLNKKYSFSVHSIEWIEWKK